MYAISRRRMLAASATAGAALSLAGCAGKKSGSGGSGGQVKVWMAATTTAKLMQSFLEQHFAPGNKDGIEIQFQATPGTNYSQQLPLALRTGQGPDVFSPNNLVVLIHAHYLMPLDDVVSDDVKNNYKNAYASPSQFIDGGKLYAIPTTAVVYKMAYNKDLFDKAGLDPDKPPTTFSQVLDAAKAITSKAQGAYGFGLPMKYNGFTEQFVEPPILDSHTNLTQRALYNVETQTYECEKYAPVVELFRSLINNKWVYPGVSSLDFNPLQAAFAQGKIGMYFASANDVAALDQTLNAKIDWAGAQLPVPDDLTYQQTLTHMGGAFAMNAKTPNKTATTKVLEAILGVEAQSKLAKAGATFPVSKAVAGKVSPKGLPQYSTFAFDPDKDQLMPTRPTDQLNIQGDDFSDTVNKLIAGSAPIEPGLKALSDKYNKALQEAVKSGKINLKDFGFPGR